MTWGEVMYESRDHIPWVVAGCLCACFAPKHNRAGVVQGAAIMLAAWFAYNSIWTPQSIAVALSSTIGTQIEYEAVWSFTDALAAMVVMAAWGEQWWAIAIWATLTIQCSGHVASQFGITPWGPYRMLLDSVFTIQWAVFILIGGPGIVDRILHILRRSRDFLSASRPALQQAA